MYLGGDQDVDYTSTLSKSIKTSCAVAYYRIVNDMWTCTVNHPIQPQRYVRPTLQPAAVTSQPADDHDVDHLALVQLHVLLCFWRQHQEPVSTAHAHQPAAHLVPCRRDKEEKDRWESGQRTAATASAFLNCSVTLKS